ncbi:hypothetical protein VTO42DRAFT_997 [Malbranchea cinnamomea]
MAFLFKSKKNQGSTPLPNATRNIHTSEGPSAPSPTGNAAVNGYRDRDGSSVTPSSSANTSTNALSGAPGSPRTPRRDRADSEPQGYPPRGQFPMNGSQLILGPNQSPYPWSQRRLQLSAPHTTPFPRYGAAVNATATEDGDIYLMGGLVDGSTVKGDLWVIQASGNSLSCFPVSPKTEGPSPRVGHASLLVGNAFIVFGGDTKMDENDTLDETLYFLNTSNRQWSRAVPPGPLPSGRYGHSLNILGSKIYIFGGQVEGYFFNDLVAFDLNALQNPGNKWEFLIKNSHEGGPPPGQIPPARTNHTMVTFNDKLYLFGGTNGMQWFNDVWSYDPVSNSWTQLDYVGFVPAPREGHAATLVGDVMYVFGGRTEEGNDLGDLAAFRITTRRWYSFHNMGPAPSPRSGHSMTSIGQQIIVMGGEPSSAPRDPHELSLVYVLDTAKIRYPNETNTTSPTGEKFPRRIGDRPSGPSGRTSREALHGAYEHQRRGPPSGRENVPSPGPGGPGSRLPRASVAQAPAGPPPPGQAPNPRPNNFGPGQPPPRMKPVTKGDRGTISPLDTVRAVGSDRDRQSPVTREGRPGREQSPISGGRHTPPHNQSARLSARAMEAGEAAPLVSTPSRQRSLRQQRQQNSVDSVDDSISGPEAKPHRNSKNFSDEPKSPRLTPHQEALMKELEASKNKNAWYAAELALARKAGYVLNTPSPATLDERGLDSFSDEDRPLIEAFLAMKAELIRVQENVERQESIAAKRVAEAEHQRDAAISEAAYARAKLAAHLDGTSQSEASVQQEIDRNTELSRRLALALAAQNEFKAKVESLTSDLAEEKRARELAEELQDVTSKRLAELESRNDALELESLRAELHHLQSSFREEAALRSQAEANLKLLEVDKLEMERKLEDANARLQNHGLNINSLREAVDASSAKAALIEKQLQAEREYREGLERKLLQLRSEHEERTAELEHTTRRLREVEELAESHAREAESHRNAFLTGLDRISSLDSEKSDNSLTEQRISALQAQVDQANELVKTSQQAANAAADKLRLAEERIAGLEAYQEQSSREGLQLRRQLQAALKEHQALSAENREIKAQLESQQRDANALAIQHGALKDLLGERGVSRSDSRRSPRMDSPGSRFGTPEQTRLRELEQQLQASLKAHEETKAQFELREQEADRAWHEKLEQLENDYQSAVHYVKGTEKMLKRMKDELSKYKAQTAKLQAELDAVRQSDRIEQRPSQGAPAEWETERLELQRSISELQASTSASISALETQLSSLKDELATAHSERDESRSQQESLKAELANIAEKSRAELEQLKKENSLLESRALDAERKVTMLLDQVETSVINYRRQSQQLGSHANGLGRLSRTHSNASSNTIGLTRSRAGSTVSQDDSFLDNRSSFALDSLANELDALRSHWESTNRAYRLSTQFDFDRTPTRDTYGEGLSDSLANWRKKLDEEESRAETPQQQPSSQSTPTQADASDAAPARNMF